MATPARKFVCSNCDATFPKELGKCPSCQSWGTLKEQAPASGKQPSIVGVKSKGVASISSNPAQLVSDITTSTQSHQSTGMAEFDRVLGGGIVAGGVILLAGQPGVGKSSLLTLVSHNLSLKENVLYISGEESVQQIKIRHDRMNATGKYLYLASENDLSKVLWHIDEIQPKFLVIDSVQTIASPDIDGRAGSPSQVTEVATILTRIAKERNIPLIFVGHFTKDGSVAGPRVVEHLVDVVLSFEGEEDSPLRLLRGIKNRFGPADEIGCFEHTETGLEEVPDPSGLLLGSHDTDISGVATSIYLEGKRALPVEVQALVTQSFLPNPRKITSGLDSARTIQIQAVLQKHAGADMRLADKDIYISTIGGMRIKEPAVDLATVVATASAQLNIPARADAVSIGEVTLSGEVRRVPGMNRRLAEAMRLGFKAALVPFGTRENMPKSILESGMTVIEIKNVSNAVTNIKGYALAREALKDD